MNPFHFKNLKSFGLPLLISFLGFFIGYTQKTDEKIEGIYQEQTKITYQMENNVNILARIELKVDELAGRVEQNTVEIAKHTKEIEKMGLRIDFLESKHKK